MHGIENIEKSPVGAPFRRFSEWRWERIPWVRRCGKGTLDLLLAGGAWALAVGFDPQAEASARGLGGFLGLALAINMGLQLTSQHYRLLDLKDVRRILFGGVALVAGSLLLFGVEDAGTAGAPGRTVYLAAGALCGMAWLLCRILVGALLGMRMPQEGKPVVRTLIVGAGRAGLRLCQEVQENPRVGFEVVGFVDDAPEKQGVRILGVPVLGATNRIEEFIRSRAASLVILGTAGASAGRMRELGREISGLGVKVRMVPGIQELVGERPWGPRRKDVAIEDLLRRKPVSLDTGAIRLALEGSVALITGAGGSIGSELARTVAGFGPSRIILLGRGENSLWEIERDLAGRFPALRTEVVLCDIRDSSRLRQVFRLWRPRVVFHAAAHKHVPYLERHPEEAVINNIFGTRNVLEAALEVETGVFVNVSTDKAVNPVNALGVSKRIAEHLVTTAALHAPPGARYVSVRFGNVLGSRGSVIPLFLEQIERGGPITVTHPDMVRYFMTIPEAAQLALQAGILGETSKVFVLDMGDPVKIVDLAEDLARLSGFRTGVDIEIKFTGTRPGEKLFEELFSELEARKADIHPKVFEAVQDRPDPEVLDRGLLELEAALLLPEGERQRGIVLWLKALVPGYQPSPGGLGKYAEIPSEIETLIS